MKKKNPQQYQRSTFLNLKPQYIRDMLTEFNAMILQVLCYSLYFIIGLPFYRNPAHTEPYISILAVNATVKPL